MKQRHRHRDRGDRGAGEAGEAVDHALFRLDIGFRLAQLLVGNHRPRIGGLRRVLGHVAPCRMG